MRGSSTSRPPLVVGLEQTRMIGKAKEDRLQLEVDKMTKELEMAKEMAVRTGDAELRERAARTEELEGREADRQKNTVYWPAINALATSMAAQREHAHTGTGPQMHQVTLMEDEGSEDEDFEAGSSGSDGDSYTSSETENPVPAVIPETLVNPSQQIQGPFSRRPSLSDEDRATGRVPPANVSRTNETTLQTTANTSIENSDPSSSSRNAQAKGSMTESEELLELDSMACESQYAYVCEWGRTRGTECRAALDSQKDLYEHLLTHVD